MAPMVQGTDGILQNYFTLSFEQCFCLQCMVVLCLALMMRWYQLYVWSLHHYIFHFYKNSSWVNILDSTGFSLYAFEVFCVMYSKYVASVPIQIIEVIGFVPSVYPDCWHGLRLFRYLRKSSKINWFQKQRTTLTDTPSGLRK